MDNAYDVILGHNFLTSYRYKMYWKEERLFMKLGFSNLIRIYINELGSKVYQCPLSLDNMPTDDSGDFVVTFSEQNAFIESAPPYELIDKIALLESIEKKTVHHGENCQIVFQVLPNVSVLSCWFLEQLLYSLYISLNFTHLSY